MSKINGYQTLIWSQNPDKLQKFYKDILQLKPNSRLTLSDDYGYGFKVGNQKLWIGKHSGVKGKNKDQFRFIVNFYVLDVVSWHEKLKDKVEVVAKPFVTPPTRGKKEIRYCFTFKDPDGNILQMMTE
jgi:predicted enzyme related to lactoylglutathione lyase